jgi:hypothetical protein
MSRKKTYLTSSQTENLFLKSKKLLEIYCYQANGDGDTEVGFDLVIGKFGAVSEKCNNTLFKVLKTTFWLLQWKPINVITVNGII